MNAMELWGFLFRLYVLLLALLLISLPFQRPSSLGRSITLVGFVFVLVPLAVLLVLIRLEWEPF